MKEKIFDDIFVQPAAGDAGGALGSALFTWYDYLDNPRSPQKSDSQKGSYLGPRFKNKDIESYLSSLNAPFQSLNDDELSQKVAGLIGQMKVVGIFNGRMEFGPRALGARSILGDPRSPQAQSTMNLKIKFRESFRPFAPAVLAQKTRDYFDFNSESPYMLMVAPVKEGIRTKIPESAKSLFGIDKLKVQRSKVPAITHVDYSARLQTLTPERNGLFYKIVKAFDDKTGCPVMINTSFNIRGEPIVCRPEEAYRCFMFTDMDALVLENCLILKENQPPMAGAEEYKRKYKLD